MIKAYVQDFGKTWEDALQFALHAYRTVPHESLGRFFPSEVMYGKNLLGPLDLFRAD